MQDEFQQLGSGIQYEPSDMFKEFADDVLVFDYTHELDEHLDELFGEFMHINQDMQVPEILYSFIDWKAARDWVLNDYEQTEINNKIYLWRKI
jgi:Rad3-related DNA helicase